MYIPNHCINTLIYERRWNGSNRYWKKCHPSAGPSNFNRSWSRSTFLMGKPWNAGAPCDALATYSTFGSFLGLTTNLGPLELVGKSVGSMGWSIWEHCDHNTSHECLDKRLSCSVAQPLKSESQEHFGKTHLSSTDATPEAPRPRMLPLS